MKTPEIGLQLQGVGKAFGTVRVVQEMDLQVLQGEFVVLLGESGCGKSTTLRMIAGLDEVSEGRIFIKGRDVTDCRPRRATSRWCSRTTRCTRTWTWRTT
jgi:ABC-type sugar transport system ATPase subunit